MYTKLGSDGIAVTVLTPVEAQGLVNRAAPGVLARPSGPVEKEIASLAALYRTVEREADDSLRPQEYHISARTHRAYGLTESGQYVLVDPVLGDLVAVGRAQPAAVRPGSLSVHIIPALAGGR